MKTSSSSACKAGLRLTGFVLLSAAVGACSAGAETFQHGGSTTIIQQSGGNSTSTSEVTRYADGQRIITQDGSSTDITVQRSGDYPPSNVGWEHPDSNTREAFKQQMLERMRSDW